MSNVVKFKPAVKTERGDLMRVLHWLRGKLSRETMERRRSFLQKRIAVCENQLGMTKEPHDGE